MSRASVQAALKDAVACDARLKAVYGADKPILAQKLPSASVFYVGDESTELRSAEGRVYRYQIRLYVRLAELERAQEDLVALVDGLDENLEAHRLLTNRAECIGDIGGAIEAGKLGESGPDLLCYTTTVRVEIRPALDVVLSDGALAVTLHEVRLETLPTPARPIDAQPTETGGTVVYEDWSAPELVSLHGRIDSHAEADRLAAWYENQTPLVYTGRRGDPAAGFRISGSPAPRIERRDAPSDQYQVVLTLYRF